MTFRAGIYKIQDRKEFPVFCYSELFWPHVVYLRHTVSFAKIIINLLHNFNEKAVDKVFIFAIITS